MNDPDPAFLDERRVMIDQRQWHLWKARWCGAMSNHPIELGVHVLVWGGFVVLMASGDENGFGWFHQPQQSLWFPMLNGALWNAVTFVVAGQAAVDVLRTRRWSAWLAGLVRLSAVVWIGKSIVEWLYARAFEPELSKVGLTDFAIENTYPLIAALLLGSVYFVVRDSVLGRTSEPRTIVVKSGQVTHRLDLAEIRYLKSEGNYIAFHLQDSRLLVLMTMDDAQALLDDLRFLRIHRSYVVNLEQVSALDTSSVFVGADSLPIGRTFRQRAVPAIRSALQD